MQPFQFNPLVYEEYKQRHEELVKQAEQYRLVKQAFQSSKPETTGKYKFLAVIGKKLASLGFSLEVRFGAQPETYPSLNQQSNPGGCA